MLATPLTFYPRSTFDSTAPQSARVNIPARQLHYIIIYPRGEFDVDVKIFDLLESESYLTMLASENILRKDWDSPEEDEAWADL